MAELKIRRGSVTIELKDDNNRDYSITWDDAFLDESKKLKVKWDKQAKLEPGQEAQF